MKVAVLCGGRSYERQVSLRSGDRVESALHELGQFAFPAGLPPYPEWWDEMASS